MVNHTMSMPPEGAARTDREARNQADPTFAPRSDQADLG